MRPLVIALALFAAGAATVVLARPRKRLGEINPDFDDEDQEDVYDEDGVERRPPQDEQGVGCGCLRIGRPNPRLCNGYTRVCLTHKQERALFNHERPSQEKLACGTFACAYTTPDTNRVVKFTTDSEDVAALLKAQKTGLVPKVYAAYRLAQPGRFISKRHPMTGRMEPPQDVTVYALVLERLRTIPPDDRVMVDDEINPLVAVAEGRKTGGEFCDTYENEDGTIGCSDLQMHVISAVDKFKKAGIKWTDIHAGNIGYDKRGKLKVLDLGLTKTQLKQRLRTLRGAKPVALVPALTE